MIQKYQKKKTNADITNLYNSQKFDKSNKLVLLKQLPNHPSVKLRSKSPIKKYIFQVWNKRSHIFFDKVVRSHKKRRLNDI